MRSRFGSWLVSLLCLSLALAPGCSCGSSSAPPATECSYPEYLPAEVRAALDSGDALAIEDADTLIAAASRSKREARADSDAERARAFGP